jgi:PIN domain nuclease of toxin-antitoxin system
VALVDASAIIAVFAQEPGGPEVEELLKRSTAQISAVNMVEVYYHFMRVHGESRAAVDDRVATLRRIRALNIVAVGEDIAARAGELRARHYHRVDRPLSLADCVAVATAEALNESLATSDSYQAAMARDECVEVIALPDSTGTRP